MGTLFCLCALAVGGGCAAHIDRGPQDDAGAGGGPASPGGSGGSAGSVTPPGGGGPPPITDAGGGGYGTGDGPSADGLNCGLTMFKLERLPPDVLLVLDRSGSMRDFAMGLLGCIFGKCNSKWIDMKNALAASVTATEATVNWGLKLFPTDNSCGVTDGVAVPVAPNNANAINMAINGTQPDGATPTRLAIEGAGRHLMSLTTPNPRYIVLATDGLPNCNGADNMGDDQAAIQAVTAVAAAGIPVFVIGVGTQNLLGGAAGGDATLSAMANAGGKPRAANPTYYPVTTSADFSAALATIGGQIVSCTLSIKAPPDPTNIAVEADGKRVPPSASNGWQYGPNMTTIQLTGSWCSDYQNGTIKNVQTIFGCPGIVIP
ncbi:MAG TPA: vWA domain-containing protein [Polyangia bacterium]|nr:vWA domain-containing protein [Polyangia bacterium]